MSMTATARPLGTGWQHEIDVNGRHTIVTDEPPRLGGTDQAATPHELLPAALAACASTMVAMYAESRGWELGEISVAVHYDPAALPRRVEIDLRLPNSLSAARRRRLEHVARTCPVRRALEAGFVFEERAAERRAPDAAG